MIFNLLFYVHITYPQRFYFATKFNEERVLFYSNFIIFLSFALSLYFLKDHHISISISKRGKIGKDSIAYPFHACVGSSTPKVGLQEEVVQNLLSLSMSEWHAEDTSSREEEIFNARRLLRPRSPWAVKGGLFSSRKGPGFLADTSRRYLVVRDASTIKREIFRRP